jgi:diacylglycerol kinase (ATP)
MADALRGLRCLSATQRHARVHAAATVLVIVAGGGLGIRPLEWAAVALAVGLVWMAEALNTAVEFLADAVHPEQHPLIGRAKDVAAAGVLLAALTAACVGVSVFGPPIASRLAG